MSTPNDSHRRKATGKLKPLIDFFGSLELTVTLLVLSIFLIFFQQILRGFSRGFLVF